MIALLLLACDGRPNGALAEAMEPHPAGDVLRGALPPTYLALVVHPDRAVLVPPGFDAQPVVHALDAAHPGLAEALWPVAIPPASGGEGFVLVLDRSLPASVGTSALSAASAAGYGTRLATGMGP